MGTSERESAAAADRLLLKMARENPLQTLTDRELRLDVDPLTTYPKPIRAKAWVRFGSIPVHVDCEIHRATANVAGIAFAIRDKTFRCWVWSNAVQADPATIP